MNDAENPRERRCLVSVANALTLMIAFGMFTISLVSLTVSIVVAILDSKKDRQ